MSDSYSITARQTSARSVSVDNGRVQVQAGAEAFQPTEMLLGGLGSCMLSMVVDYAQRNGIDLGNGASVDVSGTMANRPRRMSNMHAVFNLPGDLTQMQIDALVRTGQRCTIHATLEYSPSLTVDVQTHAAARAE